MYHRRSSFPAFSRLAAVLCLLLCITASAYAVENPAGDPPSPLLEERLAVTVPRIPLPPPQSELKTPPTTVEVYQHDEEPIGSRIPLLMVHGLRGEFREGFRWDKVVDEFLKDSEFSQRYKIYYARYNTYTLLSSVIPHFRKSVLDLHQEVGRKPITVMALSMGGNLIQESMEDKEVAAAISTVMTFGTPFHGSPLFCYDWLRYSIIRNHDSPFVRFDRALSYKLYFKRHTNLLDDLRWDNADNALPSIGRFSTWIPYHIKGDLTVQRQSNPRLLQVNSEIRVDKRKFVCYGGYLATDLVLPHGSNRLLQTVQWPVWFATCTIPYHMGFEHPVLRALNYEMGRMPVMDEDGKVEHGSRRYSLNDGITPLVSALFLPPELLTQTAIAEEPDLSTIRRGIDVKKARVFRQIDHITFIDGFRPKGCSSQLRDELHPAEGERTIFEWMLVDLLGRDATVANTTKISAEGASTAQD